MTTGKIHIILPDVRSFYFGDEVRATIHINNNDFFMKCINQKLEVVKKLAWTIVLSVSGITTCNTGSTISAKTYFRYADVFYWS